LKQRFKENKFRVLFNGEIANDLLNKLDVLSQAKGDEVVQFSEEHHGNDLLKLFIEHEVEVTAFNEILPSINEIFIRQVETN